MSTSNHQNELFNLTDDLCNGMADDAAVARLEALLRGDPQMRQSYLQYAALHADLSLDAAELAAFVERAVASQPALELADRQGHKANVALPVNATPRGGSASQRTVDGRMSRWVVACIRVACTQWAQFRADPVKLVLFVAVMVTAVSVTLMISGFRLGGPNAGRSLSPPRALTVATLTGTRNCEWLERSRDVPTAVGAPVPAGSVYALRSGRAEIRFDSGATTVLQGPAEVVVSTSNSAVLQSGSITAYVPPAAVGFTISTPSAQIVDRGTEFTATITESGETEVKVSKGSVEVHPRSAKCLWNFDEPDDIFRERNSGSPATLGRAAFPTKGLVGRGAVEFTNLVGSAVYLGNGRFGKGENAVERRGAFSATHGMTIEAVIVSRWSGDYGDYDHIFRKEDGEHRILLAFQNPAAAHGIVAMPEVPEGPCLAFGLFLKGQGYHELDMPLDGLEGRPKLRELTDGRPHYVAAVYNATTGEKSLFIDGRRTMTTNYSPGSQIVSGGDSQAVVGSCVHFIQESFNGAIDEVAWYDIALSDEEIGRHYNYIREGKDYLGNKPDAAAQSQQSQATELKANESMRFPAKTEEP